MICYRNRTWCGSPNCQNKCGRKFTEEDRQAAIKWWGSEDFPLAVSNFCGEETANDSTGNIHTDVSKPDLQSTA